MNNLEKSARSTFYTCLGTGITGLAAFGLVKPGIDAFNSELKMKTMTELHQKQNIASPLLDLDSETKAWLEKLNIQNIVTGGNQRTAANEGIPNSALVNQIPAAYLPNFIKLDNWLKENHSLVKEYLDYPDNKDRKDRSFSLLKDLTFISDKSLFEQIISSPKYSEESISSLFSKANVQFAHLQTSVDSFFRKETLTRLEGKSESVRKFLDSLDPKDRDKNFKTLYENLPFSFADFFEKNKPKSELFNKIAFEFHIAEEEQSKRPIALQAKRN